MEHYEVSDNAYKYLVSTWNHGDTFDQELLLVSHCNTSKPQPPQRPSHQQSAKKINSWYVGQAHVTTKLLYTSTSFAHIIATLMRDTEHLSGETIHF